MEKINGWDLYEGSASTLSNIGEKDPVHRIDSTCQINSACIGMHAERVGASSGSIYIGAEVTNEDSPQLHIRPTAGLEHQQV